ncbi:MAG: polysaccharide deacetylase family protein [Planctomycetes bacterium]|nr:polysaccharide deacetylase family protein [Planctomycetota bacterium]
MNHWKQLAMSGYYWGTLPARRRAAKRRAARGGEPVQILFYHRVADEHPNDWTMLTQAFAAQIDWLRARFDIVSLAEAQARIAAGCNRRPTACITFDDGYADNMRFAVPLLLKHDIPFTYFVATDHVFGGRPFPHDVAAGQPLTPNSLSELRELAAAGVEIGGHTRSHADAGKLSSKQLVDEIAGCKRELESALDCDVRYFAFPYGLHQNLSVAAFRAALDAGYEGVCSAYGGYNFPGDDPFHLRRIHADPELIRLKNWLTVDPRKERNQRDFESGSYRMEGTRTPAVCS